MIDFGLDDEQRLLVETAREFARTQVRPRLRECERAGCVPDDLRARFDALGFGMLDVPEALGGAALPQTTVTLVHEELAWGDAGVAVALFQGQPFRAVLLELGDAAQQARWLRESDGSCALGGGVRAQRVAEGYRLEGSARFVLGSPPAVVVADVDGEPAALVVADARSGARHETLGLGAVRFGELEFANCVVGEGERLLGGGDVPGALRRLAARQALVGAARQVGLARAAYEHALEYAEQRSAFGKPIGHFQAIAFLLSDVHMEVESARGLLWRAAAAWDRGSDEAVRLVSEAAIHAMEAGWRAADAAVQILGGAGYVCDHPVEKWLRDTRVLALLGGSAEGHLMTVAAALVGDDTLLAHRPGVQAVLT